MRNKDEFKCLNPPNPPLSKGGEGGFIPNSALRTPHSNGFTLIEIIMTIVLVSILSALAAMIILQGVKMYSAEQSRSDVHYQARLAMERMAREIRLIRSCPAIVGPANPSATLSFTDINGTAVAFTVAAGNLSRGGNLLASGITSAQPFSFLNRLGNPSVTCVDPNPDLNIWFVQLDMTSKQLSETLQMQTRVHPRNF